MPESKISVYLITNILLQFDFDTKGETIITQRYRHSISFSLKAQQPIKMYIIEEDDAARKAAEQYLPGSEIRVVENLGILIDKVAKNPEHVGFFKKKSESKLCANGKIAEGGNVATAFTPFPDYSPNSEIEEKVVAVAQLSKEAIIETDKPLSSKKELLVEFPDF